jgi:hypothetical protein
MLKQLAEQKVLSFDLGKIALADSEIGFGMIQCGM